MDDGFIFMSAVGQDSGQLGNPFQSLLDKFMYCLPGNTSFPSKIAQVQIGVFQFISDKRQRTDVERRHERDDFQQISAGIPSITLRSFVTVCRDGSLDVMSISVIASGLSRSVSKGKSPAFLQWRLYLHVSHSGT